MLPTRSHPDSNFIGLLRRYMRRVSAWAKGRAISYALAIGLLVIGALLLVVAIAIGTSAAFDFIALRHGFWTAYGVVGGSFAGLGAIAMMAGLIVLKARAPALPAPPPARPPVTARGWPDRLPPRLGPTAWPGIGTCTNQRPACSRRGRTRAGGLDGDAARRCTVARTA